MKLFTWLFGLLAVLAVLSGLGVALAIPVAGTKVDVNTKGDKRALIAKSTKQSKIKRILKFLLQEEKRMKERALKKRNTISYRLTKLIVEQLGVKDSEVGGSFVDDLGADSLDLVELIMAMEEEFGIEIPDEDAEQITTVSQAQDYILEHINQID